jgi:hypothetical protein
MSTHFQLLTPENSELDTDFGTGSEAGFAATSDSELASSHYESSDTETETEGGATNNRSSPKHRTSTLRHELDTDDGLSDDEEEAEGDTTILPVEADPGTPAPIRRKRKSAADKKILREQGDDDDSYGEASDEEGYAESTSSMLDSLLLNEPSQGGLQGGLPSTAQPFASEFDIPLHIDLFPERRARPASEGQTVRRGKIPFFEYLYG